MISRTRFDFSLALQLDEMLAATMASAFSGSLVTVEHCRLVHVLGFASKYRPTKIVSASSAITPNTFINMPRAGAEPASVELSVEAGPPDDGIAGTVAPALDLDLPNASAAAICRSTERSFLAAELLEILCPAAAFFDRDLFAGFALLCFVLVFLRLGAGVGCICICERTWRCI